MSSYRAPESRGKICVLKRSFEPRVAVFQFITKKVIFLFALAAAISGPETITSPAAAETGAFLAPVASMPCAPRFALPDPDGSTRALAAEGRRAVLVHFFATWCEPCKAELASLQQFFVQRGHEVGILAVNVGEVPGRVRRFLADTPVSFPVVLDADRAVARTWAVEGLPTTVVLDKTLTPKLAVTGDLDWTSADVAQSIDWVVAQKPGPELEGKCTREDSQ